MPHPVLLEIVRAKEPIRSDVLRRWQQTILTELLTPPVEAPSRPKTSTTVKEVA